MKVLLINPFSVVSKSSMPYLPHESLALEYLASVVSTDHEVRILDCIGEFYGAYEPLSKNMFHVGASLDEIRTIITSWQPDLVGVTSPFVTQIPSAYSIINLVKEIDKEIITVIGGCTVSCYPIQTLEKNQDIDIAVVGEGELTFKELLDREAGSLDKIDGIVYRNKNQIIKNNNRKLIENLDKIPFPRRDLVPFAIYSEGIQKVRGIKRLINFVKFRDNKTKILLKKIHQLLRKHESFLTRLPRYGARAQIITSRGCPFNCYYCAIHNVWNRSYRMRSAENVLDEITLLNEKYKVRHFGIVDDNFNISKKRTIAICRGVIERGLEITFRADSGVYLSTLDEETLSLMKRAGFHELYFGIESGNQKILNNIINKKINLDQVKEVTKLCRKLGIISGGFFMVGVPGETKETMEETIKFALDSDLDRIRIYTCQPFPGSKLYEDCQKEGWIADNFDVSRALIFDSKAYIQTNEFSPKDVTEIAKKGRAILRKQKRLDMPQ